MSNKINSYRWIPLLFALYEIAAYLSNDAYLPALPNMVGDLHTSIELIALSLTVWFIGSTLSQVILAPLCEHWGRRVVMIGGGGFFIIATLICGFAPNVWVLLLGRLFQGACVSAFIVPNYATINDIFAQKEAIKATSLMQSITVLAPSFGPLFGAIFMHATSWRGLFIFLALWVFCLIPWLHRQMPETATALKQPWQLKVTLNQYRDVLREAHFWRYALAALSLFTIMILWIVASPFVLIDHFHFSAVDFGFSQAIIFSGYILGNQITKRLIHRISLKSLCRWGMGIALATAIITSAIESLWLHQPLILIAGLSLLSLGAGLCLPILNRLCMETAPGPMSIKVASLSLLRGGFCVLASLLVSLGWATSISHTCLTMLVLTISATLLFMITPIARTPTTKQHA